LVKHPLSTTPPASADTYSNKRFSLGLKQILGDLRLGVVDVGGAVNLQPHWHRFHQVADFIVFEPHQQSYQDLLDRQRSGGYYRHFRYINAALSGQGGPRTLYVSNAPTGTSLLPPKRGGLADYPENSYLYPMREEVIQTTTLDETLPAVGMKLIHGIKLDTQGTEIEIMRGMGPELSRSLLLVEVEIGVVEHYATPSASLEEAIPFMRSLGLELFDLRCNRFAGNAIRLQGGWKSACDTLGCHPSSPALAQRVNEVDAIFFRDPRTFIDGGASIEDVRRLIAMLSAYNLYGEAVFATIHAADSNLLSADEKVAILAALRGLHAEASLEVNELEKWLSKNEWKNWGQYMWVPAPSC
jgi:FkbM family methyltransferase